MSRSKKDMTTMFNFPKEWSSTYIGRIERNIGLVSIAEQAKIKSSHIAILGTGGLGAPLALQLVYMGAENLTLCDRDVVDLSNLNRQPFTEANIGHMKVDVLAANLRKINPQVNLRIFYDVNAKNIHDILFGIDLVALTLDDPIASIIAAREAYDFKIPLVETWGVPYLFAWWFTDKTPPYETIYAFETEGIESRDLGSLRSELSSLYLKFFEKLMQFPEIDKRYGRESHALEWLLAGQIGNRTLAPIVWLNAIFLAIEIIYAGILGIKSMTLAPTIKAYDYIKDQNVQL